MITDGNHALEASSWGRSNCSVKAMAAVMCLDQNNIGRVLLVFPLLGSAEEDEEEESFNEELDTTVFFWQVC